MQEFEAIGVDLKPDSLGKCKITEEFRYRNDNNIDFLQGCEICTVNNITDAEEFVEQWMAYSLTNFNGADPTVTRLNEFQLKGYNAKDQDNNTATSTDDHRSFPSKRSRVSNATSILNAYGFNDNSHDKVSKG